ncbi:MAG: polyphosphate:AMP phosphotransferase, partial [Deltaproteobacteria bacterium]|nr:polyphosphate:AMP phosphotransferase [Deltaproteobacteria bacterium]
MFESAELGHEVDKATWKKEQPVLREDLLAAQFELLEKNAFPVVILVAGVDGSGRGETVNLLNAWMDPRTIETHGLELPSGEEQRFPPMWRYWRVLPPRGKIGILFGSWYTAPILGRVEGKLKSGALESSIGEINRFERMLADEGVLLLKFWFHLSKKFQKKRLKKLEKDPATQWRVTDLDWERFERYDDFVETCEHVLQRTSHGHAPWIVVEANDSRYRNLTVGKALLGAVRRRLDSEPGADAPSVLPAEPVGGRNVIASLDLTQRLEEDEYEKRLETLQGRLNKLSRHKRFNQTGVVAVFE